MVKIIETFITNTDVGFYEIPRYSSELKLSVINDKLCIYSYCDNVDEKIQIKVTIVDSDKEILSDVGSYLDSFSYQTHLNGTMEMRHVFIMVWSLQT